MDKLNYSKQNLSKLVVNHVKDKILSMELKSGDRVVESRISEELLISRAPIREAMRELEKEGLITVAPRKGACITEFKIEDIKEIFEIRQSLESDIIKILIDGKLISQEDINKLRGIVDEMVKVAISGESVENKSISINLLDMSFHSYLWEKSGSVRREKILKDMFFQLRMAMLYDTRVTDNLFDTASDHYAIIKSLEENDYEACKKHLRDHIITIRNR